MKNRKTIIITFIILLISISLFILNRDNDIDKKVIIDTDNSEYTQLEFPENDLDISDWVTYQTTSFRKNIAIEIKYPKDWKIRSYGENQAGPKASIVTYDKRVGGGADNGIYMVVEKTSIEDYIDNIENYLGKSERNLEYKKIKINNTLGYAILSEDQARFITTSIILSNKEGDRTYTFFVNPAFNISDNIKKPDNLKDYLSVLEQIILSFKLIQ